MPINSFNPLSNTIDMEPSTRELASYSNQYNGFKIFFARACHIVRPNILGGSSHLATGQYLSFNLPITYMIYAMYIYIYIYTFIYTYIHTILFISLLFWLSWTAVQRETQVRGIHEQCRMEKKNIHTYTYLHYTIIYIYT